MDALAPYRIPAAILKKDSAEFSWDLDRRFLALFDDKQNDLAGQFTIDLVLNREGGVASLNFTVTGQVETICERCMADIQMPVSGDFELLVNFGDPEDSTDEVLFIHHDTQKLDLGKHMYDFILLSIPISQRIPDCESLSEPPCDPSVLNYLMEKNDDHPHDDEKKSIWDDLKNVMDN